MPQYSEGSDEEIEGRGAETQWITIGYFPSAILFMQGIS
jgi:hypothetical protein